MTSDLILLAPEFKDLYLIDFWSFQFFVHILEVPNHF